MSNWQSLVRPIPDFPIAGVTFRDITPLLGSAAAMHEVVEALAADHTGRGIDVVAAIESRGFLFGAPLAMRLNAAFVPIRKLGKLPAETISRQYALEYGTGQIEMHRDALQPGARVLLIDDVLATGGTARAAGEMIEELGGTIAEAAFVVELLALSGRERLAGLYPVRTLLQF